MLALGTLLAQPALTQEKNREKSREDFHKKLLEKFDKDGDGKFNEEERAAAKRAMAERRGSGPDAEKRRAHRTPAKSAARIHRFEDAGRALFDGAPEDPRPTTRADERSAGPILALTCLPPPGTFPGHGL